MDWLDDRSAPLLTDLYELTMAASYFAHGMTQKATFDLFVRKLPRERSFLIACGVEHALHFLERFRFDGEAIDALRRFRRFDERFLEFLRDFRFTGDLFAVEEGEAVFGEEPILRVCAKLPEAQIVESYLLNCISFQTMIASKAARVTLACDGRPYFDFSLRRDHGAQAALLAARAAVIGGAAGTSNVLAAVRYGLEPSGTMAHSFVMAFGHELEAYRQFASDFPDSTVLLIDTYDTITGAHHAATVAREMRARGKRLQGVRIDSGDLAGDARKVREILDAAGEHEVKIFLTGDLDEHRIERILSAGAPADSFGVGTQLGTSADAASLGAVYKLASEDGHARMKLSSGKRTLPGRKQVFRFERDGRMVRDVIGLEDDELEDPELGNARPLLTQVMQDGRRVQPARSPAEAVARGRARCARTLAALPGSLRSLGRQGEYPVTLSPSLEALIEQTKREVQEDNALPAP